MDLTHPESIAERLERNSKNYLQMEGKIQDLAALAWSLQQAMSDIIMSDAKKAGDIYKIEVHRETLRAAIFSSEEIHRRVGELWRIYGEEPDDA
ncbi:MAG: hypothetical protein JWL93_1886 [Hyphomicrobiales bacterium]|nr:hypothetical protein [Hyphomicrobiales bacterium]